MILKKSKSSTKLINPNEINLGKAKEKEIKKILKFKENKNERKKNSIKNPNVLNICKKRSSIDTIRSELKMTPINENIFEEKSPLLEEPEEIKFVDNDKNKRKLSNIKKNSTSILLDIQKTLKKANLEKSPKSISRNSSNISILNYQLDKNNDYNLNHHNYFGGKNEIEATELNQICLLSNDNFKGIFYDEPKKGKIPRIISQNNNLCFNLDKDI